MPISEYEQEYLTVFDPKTYLDEYYGPEPDEETRFTTQFMVNALQTMPQNLSVLELGTGPCLYSAAVLAKQALEIHLSDYVPASIAELRRWLEDHAEVHNWNPYIKLVLEQEGQTATPKTIEQRASLIRQKVTQVTHCDVLATEPIGANAPQYDLVTAHHCTDVAASTVDEWVQVMQNISNLVKPKGWLLLSITMGATTNTFVHNGETHIFPCVSLTEQNIRQGYELAGYDLNTFCLKKLTVPDEREYSADVKVLARNL
ncbi:guanitoxin biosynthesis pre-guanitoxin forming N-methyltransferase GntF [Anaerolineales bacterium HSG25]|nr:guanitoxin biosynthesis pre-guanitoxin forming N-methyltransferase GntF [Anaerolineales bacterium HSG25]